MIIAHHIILTGYGHWLPNDPRGSLSRKIRQTKFQALGEIHYGRKKDQPSIQELQTFHAEAKKHLNHEVLWFNNAKRQAVGKALGQFIIRSGLTCYACAVLRNHAHMLIRRHKLDATEMIIQAKQTSQKILVEQRVVVDSHPVWSGDIFTAYKDAPNAVRSAIKYIAANCDKHKITRQTWDFVIPYNNWPFHKHSS